MFVVKQCESTLTLIILSDCLPFLKNAVLASALGMLLHNLKESGLPKASVMVSEWTTHWHSVTTNMVSRSESLQLVAKSSLQVLIQMDTINFGRKK